MLGSLETFADSLTPWDAYPIVSSVYSGPVRIMIGVAQIVSALTEAVFSILRGCVYEETCIDGIKKSYREIFHMGTSNVIRGVVVLLPILGNVAIYSYDECQSNSREGMNVDLADTKQHQIELLNRFQDIDKRHGELVQDFARIEQEEADYIQKTQGLDDVIARNKEIIEALEKEAAERPLRMSKEQFSQRVGFVKNYVVDLKNQVTALTEENTRLRARNMELEDQGVVPDE